MKIKRTPRQVWIESDDERLLDFLHRIAFYVDASDGAFTRDLINQAAAHKARPKVTGPKLWPDA